MPWDARTFSRHNHSLSPAQSAHAASIANAVLRRSGDDGIAIATANKWAGKHRAGGGIVGYEDGGNIVDPTQPGLSSITPTASTMNPLAQGMIQRYSSMSDEKLQELAARTSGTPQGQMIQKLLQGRRAQPKAPSLPDTQQADTPGYRAGGAMPHRPFGGGISLSEGNPSWTRREATSAEGGYLHGATPGRADAIETTAPGGSHVIPADVIAGLGQGNNLAGAKVMSSILDSGPFGTAMPHARAGHGPPHPPAPYHAATGGGVPIFETRKSGGVTGKGRTPVALSDGEFVVSNHHVLRWGNGDEELGHRLLDKWIKHRRKKDIKTLQRLPGPVKS